MEIKILEKRDNRLLERLEVKFLVKYPGAATPSRSDVKKKLVALLNTSDDLLMLIYLKPRTGKHEGIGLAHVYNSRERLEKIEPEYIIKRNTSKKEGEEGNQ
ncbi:MAG: 30S ribosomal protein S24e [Candidatus Asgardarchaeia archaeon]